MANMDKVDDDLVNSAFLVYVTYRADSAPGTTLAGRATRLLLDEALGDYITNLWTVSTAICSPKAMLFERHATAEAILVVANTVESSNLRGEERRQYVNLLIEQVLPTVENILGMGYRLCVAGHNYAGLIAKLLAQQWNVDWITFLTPMPDDQRHMPRDYFVPGNTVPTNYVKSVGLLPVFDDLTGGEFKNFYAVTTDPDVSLPELRQLAVTRQQALERTEQQAVHPEEEAGVVVEDVDAAEAAMRNNEVRAVNQQQPMDVLDDVFGASNMNIGAPRMNEQDLPNNNVIHDNGLPADLNFNDIQPPEVSVSVPDGGVGIKTTTYTETTFVPPPEYVQKDQGFLGNLADFGATYERDIIHQQGVGGQDISRTAVAPKYTTLPKNNNPPPKDAGLAAHEKLATTVLNVKPDEATVRIQQQTTVVTKKRRLIGRSKTTSETIRQGVREERTSTMESNIVNNTNKPLEYASTSKTEVVQHDHTDRNGNITENLRGRTMKEQTLYARQDGKAYDTYSNTSENLDGSKVIQNEVDQQRSEVKQASYDATNKLHKTLETENMHGTSNTTIIGRNTQTQTKKTGLVNQNVRQQQVVTQKENYIDQRKSTETDHSTGQSTTTESARANKRTAVGVESTQKTVSTANKTKGILTRKTIVKTKTERNYTKNNNNITYTNDQSQLKQVVIQEAPAAGAKGFFVTEKVKTTTHSDGKEVVKATQSLNLAAQQGLAVATAEMLDKTLDMIDLYKKGKLDKATVAASIATLFTNVGEGYFAGHAANLLTTMESHLDALGLSLVTVVGASLMRFGINWFASKSKTNNEGDNKPKLSNKATLCIDVGGALARSGLYYVTLGSEFAFKSPVMFGASQIISAGQQVITALLSENMSIKDALISVAPRVGISIASSLVSIAVQQGVTYFLGAALGGTVALSALTIVIPTLAFLATSKLLTKYFVGSAEEKELNRLLQLYKLDKNADISIIKKEYRRLCLEKHPDKGGSKEAFQALSADFDKITALHMLREAPKQDKNDAKKVSMFQTAYHKLRQVITYFRSKEISEKHIEPCFDRLDYEIQRASAEISGVKLEFFSQLTTQFEGLQEYEQKFKEKGYDNLTHLVLIVDDEIEFNKLCNACGIKDGHASQLRLVLRQLKNSNVPNSGAN